MVNITFDILARAKEFLCWEKFSDLAVQLVPIQEAVGYFIPPGNRLNTIILFYKEGSSDLSESLFLLFHEAGHARQVQDGYSAESFTEKLGLPNGQEKMRFEKEAWDFGRELFQEFLLSFLPGDLLLEKFDAYAQIAVDSYNDQHQPSH